MIAFASATSLAYFDSTGPTEVITSQDGVRRAISYASRMLSSVERRYSQTEREALAIVWSCERLRQYLIGRKFTLVTDHQPLRAIYSPSSRPSARIERWVLRLQEFDFDIRYVPGKQNIADALSRLPVPEEAAAPSVESSVRTVPAAAVPVALSAWEVERASKTDPELELVRSCLLSDDWANIPTAYVAARYELAAVGFIVLRGTRIVVPQSLRRQVLELAHEGHQGIVRTNHDFARRCGSRESTKTPKDYAVLASAARASTHQRPVYQYSRHLYPDIPCNIWQ